MAKNCAALLRRGVHLHLLLVLLMLFFVWVRAQEQGEAEKKPLPLCRASQAAAARVARFPLRADTSANLVEELDGSGQGSGEEPRPSEPMLYDEFVTAVTPFDLDAEPELLDRRLCRCEEEPEDDEPAEFDFEDATKTIRLDAWLTLGFCKPLERLARVPCVGRHQLQVVGELQASGETLASVQDTFVPCTCPRGYARVHSEPWTAGFLTYYRCAL